MVKWEFKSIKSIFYIVWFVQIKTHQYAGLVKTGRLILFTSFAVRMKYSHIIPAKAGIYINNYVYGFRIKYGMTKCETRAIEI